MERLSRRRLLATAGAGLSAGLAGCNVPTDGGGGSATRNCQEDLGGAITDDRTLDCATYRVTDDVTVESGATLTVAAGATLEFAAGTGLSVAPGGSLVGEGTEDAPITFTGQSEGRGHWRGIEYEPPSQGIGDLKLAHATIEYAGSTTTVGREAGLAIASTAESATVSVKNCEIRETAGAGAWFGPGSSPDAVAGNRITGNGGPPVVCPAGTVGSLKGDNEFAGNDADAVVVEGEGATLEGDHTWPAFAVPYRIRDTPTVAGHLTVAKGSTLAFEEAQGIHVVEEGALTAAGSEDAEITFTGTSQERGFWAGLWFENASRKENRLDNVVVEYGGGIPPEFTESPANVVVATSDDSATSRIAITNSVIRESSTEGFYFGPRATVANFAKNEVRANGTNPGRVFPSNAGAIGTNSTFADNGSDSVVIAGRELPAETKTTLRALDAGYLVEGTPTVRGTLGAEPGTVVRFAADTALRATGPGTLKLTGNDETKVELLGASEEAGHWGGVRVLDGAKATFDRAVVAHGGGTTPDFASVGANVAVGSTQGSDEDAEDDDGEENPPTLSLVDTVIRHSGANGLHLGGATKLSKMSGARIVENEGAPISAHPSLLRSLDPETFYRDNGIPAIEFRGGTGVLVEEGESYTLKPAQVGYRFFGETQVRGTLNVDPGTVLEFGENASLRVLGGGTLKAIGEGEQKVIFRGAEEKTGYWRGIQVNDSTATFETASILHGGGGERPFPNAAFRANVAVTTSNFEKRATLNLTDVRISHSDWYGVYIDHFTTVNPENVRIGLARQNHNAETLDHEPHPIGEGNHDEDG